jgi:hypothetical protein
MGQLNLTEGQANNLDRSARADRTMVIDGLEVQVRQLENDRDDLLSEKVQLTSLK